MLFITCLFSIKNRKRYAFVGTIYLQRSTIGFRLSSRLPIGLNVVLFALRLHGYAPKSAEGR